jgi:ketosteroid isomerase-like protein
MKYLAILILVFSTATAYGQLQEKLQTMVDAEKAFANTSKEKSTRAAFTSFLGDSGLIFQKTPVLGKKFWQGAEEGKDMLTWEPVFADIAQSGDMGYTTGPWEYRSQRKDTAPAAKGYFVSVWKQENNGWKVALDIGISYPESAEKESPQFIAKANVLPKAKSAMARRELLATEQSFIEKQTQNGWNAYDNFKSSNIRIYRPGSFPFINEERRKQLFSETDKKFSYEMIDAKTSSSGDLGYAYGKATINLINDGSNRSLNGHYLRIWKKENGKDWKIVLDLVNIAR